MKTKKAVRTPRVGRTPLCPPLTQESPFLTTVLRWALRHLSSDDKRRFRRKLNKIPLKDDFVRIPKEMLKEASASRLGDLLLKYYGVSYALKVAADALRAVGCEYEADKLLDLAREDYSDMSPGMQRNVRKENVWSLEEVTITGDNLVCKGRKELLEIIGSPLFAEEGRSEIENPEACGESVVCNLCPCEDLPEAIRPEVFLDSEMSCERYRKVFCRTHLVYEDLKIITCGGAIENISKLHLSPEHCILGFPGTELEKYYAATLVLLICSCLYPLSSLEWGQHCKMMTKPKQSVRKVKTVNLDF